MDIVIQNTATGTPVGVFYGVFFTATDGTPTFSKVWTGGTATLGSADAEALVYSDPGIVYEAQFTAGTHAVSFIGSKYISQQLQVVQLLADRKKV